MLSRKVGFGRSSQAANRAFSGSTSTILARLCLYHHTKPEASARSANIARTVIPPAAPREMEDDCCTGVGGGAGKANGKGEEELSTDIVNAFSKVGDGVSVNPSRVLARGGAVNNCIGLATASEDVDMWPRSSSTVGNESIENP